MGKAVLGGVILLIVVIVLIVASFFWGTQLVDILLILAALFALIAFALLGYAAMQIVALVKEIRGEMGTLVGTARETMTEVQGTARFISDNVVQPVSQAVSLMSAARATARSFTEPLYKRRGGP